MEPLWVEFAALIGVDERPEFAPSHPWGCHRRRIGDRVVFDHVIAALVHGSGYERIATLGCSDRTIRRRLDTWAAAGHGRTLLRLSLAAYHRVIGLDLDDLSVDGAITKARCADKRKAIVKFYLNLAAALTVIRRLINRARTRYRWPTRPTTRRLR
ncbi:hypothetical protein LWC35_14275 [Pseudonocardia kujensis]|uniref:hypothetical protein n=1 Tax=Pseudonocardia kujensis TaxID=1128675 RepID=UPI001E5BC660|nr:hypothetical protein [Pseudonocardia kujensis]MCE0764069.1 hypothetical protein [Pseudonocardia kujensis]